MDISRVNRNSPALMRNDVRPPKQYVYHHLNGEKTTAQVAVARALGQQQGTTHTSSAPHPHTQGSQRVSAPQSKYAELLAVIEDMSRDIRPTYAGSRTATERLKRGIVHARALVRECLAETERSART
ncbi:cyclin-dependent kinase 2-associated protein 1-like [Anneissia japonica]|uniref:cyclin-dependent kinase 2-associated protein 1-like n=1 Tax=Anneissia japonica TaxID=1529436 RepID=UPI001425A1A0|nr:cyclin-dependent kinase 2-associated protein 1-like [Anneissia japonica]